MRIVACLTFLLAIAGCTLGSSTSSSPSSSGSSTTSAGSDPATGAGSSSSASSTVHPATGGQSGTVELRLVDAPNPTISQVLVTVDHVDVEVDGVGWKTVSSTPQSVDLLQLQNGAFASLTQGGLPTGHITQLRLYLGTSTSPQVVTPDGQFDLQVPSGTESGIKIVGSFDVSPCQSGQVTIDFDAAASVSYHGGGGAHAGSWMLQPVIKLKSVSLGGACDDAGAADDGGAADAGEDPATDCADVTCPDGQFCMNGACSSGS